MVFSVTKEVFYLTYQRKQTIVPLIKPKDKYVRISMKEIWRNLDGLPEKKCGSCHNGGGGVCIYLNMTSLSHPTQPVFETYDTTETQNVTFERSITGP